MAYDQRELTKLKNKVDRKLKMLRLFTEHANFNYEAPIMTYDKQTGNVTIVDPMEERAKAKRNPKIISDT